MPSARQRLAPAGAAACILAAFALIAPSRAAAHAFLVGSNPEPGARLKSTPAALVMRFSERPDPASVRVSLSRPGGAAVPVRPVRTSGVVVRQPVPPRLRGIIVASWSVVSADDGHLTQGELAFAVGAARHLPSLSANSSSTSTTQVIVNWLLFAGLALALGGAVSERLVWRPLWRTAPRAPVSWGMALALVGSVGEYLLVAGGLRGGGLSAGLRAGALSDAATSRPGILTLIVLVGVAAAAFLAPLRHSFWPLVACLLAAIVATSLRSHADASGHAWAVIANAVHLGAAALWAGALSHLVLVVARLRGDSRPALSAAIRRYARLALPVVLVLLASGLVNALAEFTAADQLFTTAYGRTLLAKGAVAAVALALALSSRLRALPANPTLHLPLLTRLTRGEAAALAGVLAAAALLASTAPPRSQGQPPAFVLGPAPLRGPTVRLADLAGQLVVGLAANHQSLELTVLGADEPARDARITVSALEPRSAKESDLVPRSCGSGCFTLRHRLRPGTTKVLVRASAPEWNGGRARFDLKWPVRRQSPVLLRRVVRAMRAVPRLRLTERVTSGPGASPPPEHAALSGATFLRQGELYKHGAVDVTALNRGWPRRLAFALPGSEVWYRMTIDHRRRILAERIVDPGHLIRRRFAYP